MLDKAEGPHKVGESVKGFAYMDMKQKLRLTTLGSLQLKKALAGGMVTEVRKDLRVFVDTGLRGLLSSLDILRSKICAPKGRSSHIRLEHKKVIDLGDSVYQKDFQRLPVQPTTICKTKLASHCLLLEIVWNLCLPSREQYAGLYPPG